MRAPTGARPTPGKRLRVAALACGSTVAIAAALACSAAKLSAVGLATDDLTEGLMAHYTFDDGEGGLVRDHSGQKRDGTLLEGGTWITDGKFAGALHLDGTGYVTVDNFPNAPPSYTVAGWFRTADSTSDAGVQTFASTEYVFDAGWEVNVYKQTDGGYLQAAYWDREAGNYDFVNSPTLTDNVWTHFAFVVDGGAHTITAYLDGRAVGSQPTSAPTMPGTPSLSIGRWSMSDRMLVGDVDDIVIYGRALAASEIVDLTQRPPTDGP